MSNELMPTAFTKPEQVLLEKIIEAQKTLKDRTDISPRDQVDIRKILIQAQRSLASLARNHQQSHVLLHFYRDINQFVRQVDDLEMMLCQTLTNLQDSNSEPTTDSDEAKRLESSNPASGPVALKELFHALSIEGRINFLTHSQDLIGQIEHVGRLSTAVYNTSIRFNEDSERHDLLDRFEALEVVIAKVINDINDVIEGPDESEMSVPENDAARAKSENDSSSSDDTESETDSEADSEDEEYDDFGFYALHVGMQKQVMALIERFNNATEKRIDMLKLISRFGGKEPSPASSRESSTSSSSSSSSYSSLFSQPGSPAPKNPNNPNNNRPSAGPGV